MLKSAPSLVALALTLFTLAGCEDGTPKPPDKAAVQGKVQLDGKPMTTGEIHFIAVGQPPQILPISNGGYIGEAFIGKNRVEIGVFQEGPPSTTDPPVVSRINTLPARYNSQSTLAAEVGASSTNEFNFEVTSR